MKLFDSHAHYEDQLFDNDRDEILSSFKDSEIEYILNCCSDISVFDQVIDIIDNYSFVYGSIGIHPHWVLDTSDNYIEIIKQYLNHPKIVALGEIGLDYYFDDPKDLQKEIFEKQLQLAISLNKPVIIHDRDAHEDCFEILRKYKPQGILHRYGGPCDLLLEAISWGMYVSFNNDLSYPMWQKPHLDCLMVTPLENMLIETDCPYAPPYEKENERCTSHDLKNVVQIISKVKNIDAEYIAEITLENAKKIYRIND